MGSGFSCREATAADLERVTEIKVRNWADAYGSLLEPAVLLPFLDRNAQLAELREKLAEPGTLLLVAEDVSGDIVGFALTYLEDEPEPWLESLHVPRELRGSGIGRLLMRCTAEHVIARGHSSMRLGVISGNVPAARFYDGLGGEMIGLEPVTWAEGVAHEVYRWADLSSLIQRKRE
ncbi:MAG TPA: GNAT family N-acetyltransferase [Candidatus Dormibacteraeota bacterium]